MNILFMTSAPPFSSPFSTDEKRPPLGLGILMSLLKKEGIEVFFQDEYLRPSAILDDEKFLIEKGIDYVGIYSSTICYSSTLKMFHEIEGLRQRKKWQGKIIVGGPHTSFGVETIPEFVDHIVIGEGEIAILKILNGEVSSRVVVGEKVSDIDLLPRPAWEEFIHLPYHWVDPWVEESPVYTLNTSRGCPFNCSFCSVKGVWGKTYRKMSAERILDDIDYMKIVYGMKVAYFREDHFALNIKRTTDFCEGLIKKGNPVSWMAESRADSLRDPEMVALMAKSGCKLLYIGVESGSPRMLEFFKKGETVNDFITAFTNTRRYGIKTYASFVVGAPTETVEDVRLTEEFINEIKPDYFCKNIFVGIPGSELYDFIDRQQMVEYQDSSGVRYLEGHNKKVDTYYAGNAQRKAPVQWEGETVSFVYERILRLKRKLTKLDVTSILHQYDYTRESSLLRSYLKQLLLATWNETCPEKIGFYGGGSNCIFMLDLISEMNLVPPVVVFDSSPKDAMVTSVPVVDKDQIKNYKLSHLVITNDRVHYEILYEMLILPSLEHVEVVDPYLTLPYAPYERS